MNKYTIWWIRQLNEWKRILLHKQVLICLSIVIFLYIILVLFSREQKYLVDKYGVCTFGYIVHIDSFYLKATEKRVTWEFKLNNLIIYGSMGKGYFISIYGDTSLYVGKKVRVKYVPKNPSNNTLVSLEEPCKCDSLSQ